MYKVSTIKINGFWSRVNAESSFNEDVNIIIGDNGSGKTTFMNILYATLAIDIKLLAESDFEDVEITLVDLKSTRTIKVSKNSGKRYPFPTAVYKISNRRFEFPLVTGREREYAMYENRFRPGIYPRGFSSELNRATKIMRRMVSLASLSVYRTRETSESVDSDSNYREEGELDLSMSTVDRSLRFLVMRLSRYQLELSNQARDIGTELQGAVLKSLLHEKQKNKARLRVVKNFDKDIEIERLRSAYLQLGLQGEEIESRIRVHIDSIGDAVEIFKSFDDSKNYEDIKNLDIEEASSAFDSWNRTNTVVELSLGAEQKIETVFREINLFIRTINKFTPHKIFSMKEDGGLSVRSVKGGNIPIAKLSSGEKQLLILLIETLLQKQKPYVFLADEPELSLHVSWQQLIVSAVKELNPNSQIIVATHSPEIAGKFRDSIIDMEQVLDG